MPARVARQPQDDEESVMRYLMRHIRYCMCCWTSIESRRATQLCSRGSEQARDVLQYMYFKHGKAFSLLDWQRGYGDVQIEVPHRYMPLNMLFNQCAGPSDNRPSSDRATAWTYRTRNGPKTCVHETDDVDRSGKAKDSRPTDQVDEHLNNYITIYAAIPAMTIPLRVKQADLRHNT